MLDFIGMKSSRHQKGVILVVALIFLLMISIVAVSGARRALIAERLGFNHWEREKAFQAAEAAVIDGSEWLTARTLKEIGNPEGDDNGSADIWSQGLVRSRVYDPDYDDWAKEGVKLGQKTGVGASLFENPPYYLIENGGWVCDNLNPEECAKGFVIYFYHISGQGYGDSEHSRAVVQSTLSKRFR